MAKAPLNNDTLPPVAPTGHTTSPDDTMMMIRAFTSSRTDSDDVSHSNASSAQHPGTHFKLSTSNESQGNTAVSDDATAVDLDALTDGNAFMRAGASVDPNKTVIMTHLDQEPTDQIASDDLDGLDLAALESSPINDTYDGYARLQQPHPNKAPLRISASMRTRSMPIFPTSIPRQQNTKTTYHPTSRLPLSRAQPRRSSSRFWLSPLRLSSSSCSTCSVRLASTCMEITTMAQTTPRTSM